MIHIYVGSACLSNTEDESSRSVPATALASVSSVYCVFVSIRRELISSECILQLTVNVKRKSDTARRASFDHSVLERFGIFQTFTRSRFLRLLSSFVIRSLWNGYWFCSPVRVGHSCTRCCRVYEYLRFDTCWCFRSVPSRVTWCPCNCNTL